MEYKSSQNEQIILPLSSKVNELIDNYDKAEPLFYSDIAGARYRTTRNTRKKIRHRNISPLSRLIGISGGILPSFWFRRHINQMFNDILSTCYLYLRKENDLQTIAAVNRIIQYVNENREKFTSKKSGSTEKFRLLLNFVSIILGFITLSGFLSFYTQISRTVSSFQLIPTSFTMYDWVFIQIVVSIVTIILEIPLLWIINRRKWYRRVMNDYDFKNKERDIYDYLVLMQKSIITRFFPHAQIKLEE